MTYRELTISDLTLAPADVFEAMGYGDATPDAVTARRVDELLAQAARVARPRYCFTVAPAAVEGAALRVGTDRLGVGRIIARQLSGTEAVALFVCTAGGEFDAWMRHHDMVDAYLADAIGTVVAERTADAMEAAVQATVDKLGWRHTNRFSPGYCGWSVAEQHRLFALTGSTEPCGVRLTEGALMVPVKSVSGVIGLGSAVTLRDYACRLCTMAQCFRRRQRQP